VAQGNQVAGFFCGHDAGNPGDAKYVAFFSGAFQDDGQCGRIHGDAALRHSHPVGGRFGGYINHVRLPLAVKMCQR